MILDDDVRIGRLSTAYKGMLKTRTVLLHETMKLGYPRFVNQLIDTAAVGESEDGRIVYYWNRAFFDSLTNDDDLKYVCAHEALHIILGHSLRRKERDPERWNVACDIAVNTLLDYSFGLKASKNLSTRITAKSAKLSLNSRILTQYDVLSMTVEEIYDTLPEEIGFGMSLDDHGFWDTLTEEKIEAVRRAIEKHAKSAAGRGSTGEMLALSKLLTKPFPWQRLLRGKLATVKKPRESESWVRANRKIYAHYPRILLPGQHEGDDNTSSIFCSIDTSGSMSQEAIEDLVSILGSLPRDQYDVRTTWFDDGLYEAHDLAVVKGRGGTSFQKIEDVCNSELPIIGVDDKESYLSRYPDVTIVMTDGYAPSPTLRYPGRWIWIITERGSVSEVKDLGCTVWHLGAMR
jgi:predicted metal-dependent peptidase